MKTYRQKYLRKRSKDCAQLKNIYQIIAMFVKESKL